MDIPVVTDIVYFHPETWGFMIQFDEHIFQMGWFNHRLVYIYIYFFFLDMRI